MPYAQHAFDLMVQFVETGVALPPSQCVPPGGAISATHPSPASAPSCWFPDGAVRAFKSRNPQSCLYSIPQPKPIHGKRIISSFYLYPGQTSAGTFAGVMCNSPGIQL